jgi:2-succinyl-6-hydroxy-2,4-cyclohexadiene-1-carboxylate synthase
MIIALHGFLGLREDWMPLAPGLGDLQAIDLWKDLSELPAGDAFMLWSEKFAARVREENRSRGSKSILLGYSMGGRLAMSAALMTPDLFSAAIFVSANPGLASESDRTQRRASDEAWARKFLNEPWDLLSQEWNAQPVLATSAQSKPLARTESEFQRKLLALSMERWSLGAQRDMRRDLATLPIPSLYITGEADRKFTEMTASLKLGNRHRVIEGAGHRVPWDQPERFTQAVQDFARSIAR